MQEFDEQVNMSGKDLRILAYLRSNARIPLTKMSKMINIPVSTIFDRLKTSEENLITKHTSLLDYAKLGYHTRANISLKVHRDDKEGLQSYLMGHDAINSAYRINNGFDFMVEGIFRHILDLENFLDEVESRFKIEKKDFHFVIKDLKREAFLSNPELFLR